MRARYIATLITSLLVSAFNLNLSAQGKLQEGRSVGLLEQVSEYTHSSKFKEAHILPYIKNENVNPNELIDYVYYYLPKEERSSFFEAVKAELIDSKVNTAYFEAFGTSLPAHVLKFKQAKSARPYNLKASVKQQAQSAPQPGCENMDFGSKNYTGWDGSWGKYVKGLNYTKNNPTLNSGFDNSLIDIGNNYAHAIMTKGTDSMVPAISCVPPGGGNAIRLGSAPLDDNNPVKNNILTFYKAQRVSRTFLVTDANKFFSYQFAAVLQDPTGSQAHSKSEEPYFKVRMFTQNSDTIDCATYNVISTNASSLNFKRKGDILYKDWTTVSVPLINYIGQSVTIEFTTADCAFGGHFGYAYISCICPVKAFETTPLTCVNNAMLTAPSGFYSYVWTGPGIVKKIGANGVEVNQPGKYSVTLTTFASPPQPPCVVIIDTVIPKLGGVKADFSFKEVCFGQAVQFKNLSTPDSSSNIYEWDFNGDGAIDSKIKSPSHVYPTNGSFNVKLKVTDIYGCTDTKTIALNQNPKIDFKVTTTNPPCKQNLNSIDVTVTGGSGTLTYKWMHGVVGTTNLTGVTTGIYKLYATDSKGCSDSVSVNYVATPDPKVKADFSFTDVCFGKAMPFTNKSTPNLGDNIYEWDFNADGTVDSKAVNPTYTWASAGVHKIKLTTTIAAGCKHDTTISITQDPKVVADFSFSKVCFGVAMPFVNKSAPKGTGISYAWDFNADGTVESTTENPNYTWPAGGSFNVKLTTSNAKGCKSDTVFAVSQNSKIEFVATTTNPLCKQSQNSINVTVSGGTGSFTYKWGHGVTGTTSLTGVTTGVYKLYATDAANCKDSLSVNYTAKPDPKVIADFSFSDVCFGKSMSFINKSIPVLADNTYAWDFNADGSVETTDVNALHTWSKAGTYKVRLTTTTALGCKRDTTITLTQDSKVVADFSFSKVCFGNAMPFINKSTPKATGNNYAWDFNDDGSIESRTENASYTWPTQGNFNVRLTNTNAKGCKSDTLFTVSQNSKIEMESSVINSKCSKSNASATVAVRGGTGSYPTAIWSNQKTGYTINNIYDGTYTFRLKDTQGCGDSLKVVFAPDTNKLYAHVESLKNITCFDSCNGSASIAVDKGVAPYTYLWTTNPVIKEASVSSICAGTYTCTVVDKEGCISTTSVVLTKPDKLVATPGPEQSICYGQQITLQGTISGGTPAYVVTWKPAGPVIAPKSTTEYTITATDKNGCVAAAQKIKVIVGAPLKIQATVAPDTICIGKKSTLTASATGGSEPYNFKWINVNNGAIGASQVVSPTTSTIYTVVLTDKCAIKADTAKVRVVVNTLPVIKFVSKDSSGCAAPLCIDFSNLTPNTKTAIWNFGDGTIKEVKTNVNAVLHHCYQDAGKYPVSLSITDKNGCVNSKTVNEMITVFELPKANFSFTPITAPADQGQICFKDESTNGYFINWNFGDRTKDGTGNFSDLRNPCHTYNDSGTFCITQYVQTDLGCKDTVEHCLIITPDWSIYVPNAFTPNRSGPNETFFAKARGIRMERFSLRVFDRWGNFIFQSNNINEGWDGTVRGGGEIAQQDVYVWQITAFDIQGRKHDLMGTVTLIK